MTSGVRRRFGAALGLAATLALTGVATPAGASSGSTSASKARARKDALHLADLPKGWKADKTASTTTAATHTTSPIVAIAACEGTSTSGVDTTPPHAGVQFTDNGGLQTVIESVGVFPSASMALKVYGLFQGSTAAQCMGQSLISSINQGATADFTTAKATSTSTSFPVPGASSTAIVLTVPFSVSGQELSLKATVVVLRKGAVISLLAMLGVGTSLTKATMRSVAKKAAGRLH